MKIIAGHGVSAVLGAVFVYAGLLKVVDPGAFLQSILNYQLIDGDLAWGVALFLPWLEIAAGIALILPPMRRGALLVLLFMLLVFQGGLASAWARGLDIECGCFGETGTTATMAFFRNGFLLATIAFIAWTEAPAKTSKPA